LEKEELYDLSRDKGEVNNLLPGTDENVEPFRRQAEAYMEEVRSARAEGRGERIVIDEELEKRLRALGYIEK
jgi:hypothetical protein